jgi:hypothetical protein
MPKRFGAKYPALSAKRTNAVSMTLGFGSPDGFVRDAFV